MSCSPTPAKKMRMSVNAFPVGELKTYFMPTLKLLMDRNESSPFLEPVDPVVLNIPTYFDIIKTPMDLSTIKKKLETDLYNDPWEFIDDVWLMFKNAWTFNNKTNIVYKFCTKLSEIFGPEIDQVMKKLGYCCGRNYSFRAQIMCCYGKDSCVITRNAKYYVHPDGRAFCVKCFTELPECHDVLTDHTYSKEYIKKSLYVEATNDKITPEAFVNCVHCHRKMHRICVLQIDSIWPEGYICPNCSVTMNTRRAANKYTAEGLRKTKLGDHIEKRVCRFINKQSWSKSEEQVTVRVLSSVLKRVQVKEGMKARFVDSNQMSGTFPYISKSIFAFQQIDGVDVCFFGMHVQEYGSDAPPPNSRRVYISYLDSVQFFRPNRFRTEVYHEILLGYLEYVKKLGYNTAHIWACPPQNGDDYIFHVHPEKQKIPTAARLLKWYKKMLNKGLNEHIVEKYIDIFYQAMEDKTSCASKFPYFDGDFWSDKLEDFAKEIDNSETQPNSPSSDRELSPPQQKESKKKLRVLVASDDLTAKLFSFMQAYHEDFLIVHLQSNPWAVIHDPDPLVECDLMDGRDSFLMMARENHFDFSCLRRSKYGTMMMLYEIHNQQEQEYVCNGCAIKIKTRFHCTVCEDFDLCIQCKHKIIHQHKMRKVIADRAPVPVAKVGPTRRSNNLVGNFAPILPHTSKCNDQLCKVQHCPALKSLALHIQGPCVKRGEEGGCKSCTQCIIILYSHAKNCIPNKQPCSIPGCYNIKLKIWQKNKQRQLMYNPVRRRQLLEEMQSKFGGMSSAANVNVHPATAQVIQNTLHNSANFQLPPRDVNGTNQSTLRK